MQDTPRSQTTASGPSVYRHGGEGARSRLEELVKLRRKEIDELPAAVRFVFIRRLARSAAGGTAIVGALCLAIATLYFLGESQGELTLILLGSSVAAIPAYALAVFWGEAKLERELTRLFSPGKDVFADIDRLSRLRPIEVVRNLAESLERASIALPLIAKALLIPLTLHFLVAVLVSQGEIRLSDFDEWINISALLVGHSHLVLAFLCWRFAKKLSTSDNDVFAVFPVRNDWGRAFGITVATSAVPGLVLFAVPVIVVILTGLAFIPFMFHTIKRQIMRERATLDLEINVEKALG